MSAAEPMSGYARLGVYLAQRRGGRITPRQRRRLAHKALRWHARMVRNSDRAAWVPSTMEYVGSAGEPVVRPVAGKWATVTPPDLIDGPEL